VDVDVDVDVEVEVDGAVRGVYWYCGDNDSSR